MTCQMSSALCSRTYSHLSNANKISCVIAFSLSESLEKKTQTSIITGGKYMVRPLGTCVYGSVVIYAIMSVSLEYVCIPQVRRIFKRNIVPCRTAVRINFFRVGGRVEPLQRLLVFDKRSNPTNIH